MLNSNLFTFTSLKQLDEKIKSHINNKANNGVEIVSEYVCIDKEIEGLWIHINSTQELLFSKLATSELQEGSMLHFAQASAPIICQIGNAPSKQIKQGLLRIPANELYQVASSQCYRGEWLFINFTKQWCSDNLPSNSLLNNYRWHPIHSYFLNTIRDTQNLKNNANKFLKKSLIVQFIFQVIQDLINQNPKWDENIGINQVKVHLTNNLHQAFPSTKELSIIGYMSISQLKNKFRQVEGVSLQQFFIDKRMEAALIFLEEGLPIKEIAFRIGYSNSSNFIHAFRKKYGISPSKYMIQLI